VGQRAACGSGSDSPLRPGAVTEFGCSGRRQPRRGQRQRYVLSCALDSGAGRHGPVACAGKCAWQVTRSTLNARLRPPLKSAGRGTVNFEHEACFLPSSQKISTCLSIMSFHACQPKRLTLKNDFISRGRHQLQIDMRLPRLMPARSAARDLATILLLFSIVVAIWQSQNVKPEIVDD
jgi:hypothetical protein